MKGRAPQGPLRVTFIVLNYNNAPDTLRCLDVLQDALLAEPGLSLVVVDNDSSDGSGQLLEEWCTTSVAGRSMSVQFVRAAGNLGYGPGNNAGIAVAKRAFASDWYWILNNDAYPVRGAYAAVAAHLETTKADIVGMRIHTIGDDPNNDIIGGGKLRRWQGRTVMSTPARPHTALDFVSGSSFLVRAGLVDRIGGFVSDHFLFWEEIEYAHRARRVGSSIEVLTEVVVNHVGGAVSGARKKAKSTTAYYYSTRSAVLFYSRHESPLAMRLLEAARAGLALHCLVRGNPSGARAVLRGLLDGRRMIGGAGR